MYNSNDVDGETNRPIVKTMDQSVIDAYNTANPEIVDFLQVEQVLFLALEVLEQELVMHRVDIT